MGITAGGWGQGDIVISLPLYTNQYKYIVMTHGRVCDNDIGIGIGNIRNILYADAGHGNFLYACTRIISY